MTFEGLCFIAALLFVWLVLCDINEVILLDERRTEERREAFRLAAYARTKREATIKRNRTELMEMFGYDK